MENNRQRVSIPIRGLDTSSTDINAPDGAMQELHNLRYSGEAWRNVKPFQVLERVCMIGSDRVANKIFCDFDKEDTEYYIVSQFPVASDINITAYWWDVDGEYTSTTSATLKTGMSRVHIEETQESFGWIELNIQSDDRYIYYTDRDSVPKGVIDWEVVYQHPADDDDVYIGKRLSADQSSCELLRVLIKDGEYTILSTIAEGMPTDVRASHFGNVLIFSSSLKGEMYSYVLQDKEYIAFNQPKPPAIHQSMVISTTGTKDNAKCTKIIPSEYEYENIFTVPLYSVGDDSFLIPSFEAGGFYGEICYFAVFQMVGGQLISPGHLTISASELFSHKSEFTKYTTLFNDTGEEMEAQMMVPDLLVRIDQNQVCVVSDSYTIYTDNYNKFGNAQGAKDPMIIPWAFFISPYIQITIPDVDRRLIKSVQIYSTRVNPIWDAKKLKAAYENRKKKISTSITESFLYRSDASECLSDNKLPEQPFYLMKDIPIDEFTDGVYNMYITEYLLSGIEQKKSYEAIDAHRIFPSGLHEYNERLHTSGDLQTHLVQGFGMDYYPSTLVPPIDDISKEIVEIKREFGVYYVESDSTNIKKYPVASKILSYPDYNAEKLYIKNEFDKSYSYILRSSPSNNFAYEINESALGDDSNFGYKDPLYTRPSFRYVKYDVFFTDNLVKQEAPDNITVGDSVIKSSNILRVSAPNNPLVWPLANSYAIGSEENEIIAVNSAAIEMSDSKFGEFPLYAFTKEGIFALQSGTGKVLYGAIVPLNYDRIINPNTLAVNYNILYITDRGVHALYSNESALISEQINDAANQPLLDFLRTAKMAYQHKHGEVIFFNTNRETTGLLKYPRAYTFSLGAKVWGTRDWNGDVVARELLNSGDMIEQTENSIILSDLNNEDRDDTASFRLVSRPISFNTQEFKRIETMVTRLQASPAEYLDIKIEGSNDLVHWVTLRDTTTQTASDINIRRTPCSCRYFRVSVDCTTMSDVAIMGFDFEYYMRFLHRMR